MDGARFDALAKALATRASRRATVTGLGAAVLAALGVARLPGGRVAGQDATPVGTPPAAATPVGTPVATADVQAWLDALDANTRSSLAQALWVDDLSVDVLPADACRTSSPRRTAPRGSANGWPPSSNT